MFGSKPGGSLLFTRFTTQALLRKCVKKAMPLEAPILAPSPIIFDTQNGIYYAHTQVYIDVSARKRCKRVRHLTRSNPNTRTVRLCRSPPQRIWKCQISCYCPNNKHTLCCSHFHAPTQPRAFTTRRSLTVDGVIAGKH